MPLWPPKSVQQLVLSSFILAVVPFGIAILFTMQTLGELVVNNRNVTRAVVDVTRIGREVQRDVLELERRAFQYAALADADLAELFERERTVLLEKLQSLQDRLPPASASVNELSRSLDQLDLATWSRDPLQAGTATAPGEALAAAFTRIGEQERAVQQWLQRSVDDLLARKAAEADDITDTLQLQIALLLAATLALLLYFTRWINRPLQHLIQEVHQLGTSGLGHRIDMSGPEELRALGSKLEWLRQSLHESEQQKQQFLRHISHELKTPLASMREATELLSDEVPGRLSRQQREIVAIARDNAIELQRLIENLLDFNQLPRQELAYETVRVEQLWQELLANYRILIDRKGLRLDLHGDVDDWVADPGKLRTALDNLLSNAINYTPDGGRIDITWRAHDASLVIDVANSGEPIPPEDVERVFEPFVQSRARRSGPIKGSGLGLSVARECIEVQGGSLSLASHETLPTCFRLVCPAH